MTGHICNDQHCCLSARECAELRAAAPRPRRPMAKHTSTFMGQTATRRSDRTYLWALWAVQTRATRVADAERQVAVQLKLVKHYARQLESAKAGRWSELSHIYLGVHKESPFLAVLPHEVAPDVVVAKVAEYLNGANEALVNAKARLVQAEQNPADEPGVLSWHQTDRSAQAALRAAPNKYGRRLTGFTLIPAMRLVQEWDGYRWTTIKAERI